MLLTKHCIKYQIMSFRRRPSKKAKPTQKPLSLTPFHSPAAPKSFALLFLTTPTPHLQPAVFAIFECYQPKQRDTQSHVDARIHSNNGSLSTTAGREPAALEDCWWMSYQRPNNAFRSRSWVHVPGHGGLDSVRDGSKSVKASLKTKFFE